MRTLLMMSERERERVGPTFVVELFFFQELNLRFPSTQYYSYIQINDVITESLMGLLFSECNIARTTKAIFPPINVD
jgi:hypothetical protein